MKVEITKINIVDNPLVASASSIDEYGKSVWDSLFRSTYDDTHLSPPIEYTVTGELNGSIEVGNCLTLLRESRNGVNVPGIFRTTPIQSIEYREGKVIGFTTKNSLYTMKVLD